MTAPVLVLDLDGTLVDTLDDLVAALNAVLDTRGMSPVHRDSARPYVGNGSRAMLQAAFDAERLAVTPEAMDALFESFLAYYSVHIADYSRPFAGTEAMLDRFAAEGWRLAVCTNKLEALARQLLDALGLADRFAVIAGQDTFGVRKPDPRHLTETIRQAGGSPALAVMVGDSQTDIDTAKAAGVPVVAVSFGYSATPIADLRPDRLIDHFDGLWDAVASLRGGLP